MAAKMVAPRVASSADKTEQCWVARWAGWMAEYWAATKADSRAVLMADSKAEHLADQ